MSNRTLSRLILLGAVSLGLMALAKYSSLSAHFSLDGLQKLILEAGAYGIALFVLLFAVGIIMNVPGLLYLIIGFTLYGPFKGFAIVYLGSLVAVIAHFLFARSMAGEALGEVKHPFIRKQMDRLRDNPIRTSVVLRLIFYVSPPVNYAFALAPIRTKDFIIGSIISLPFCTLLYHGIVLLAKEQIKYWFM